MEFVKKKYLVFTPVNDGSCVDLIVIIDGICIKVQVKTSRKTGSGFRFSCYRCTGGKEKKKYTTKEIDAYCTMFDGKLYLIPIGKCKGFDMTLRTDMRNNCNNGYIPNFAKEYLL